jgi:hypothetical protein
MQKNLYRLIFVLFLLPMQLKAQMWPFEGRELHYRIIGFTLPMAQNATTFKVEIADGTYYDEAAFEKNIIKSAKATTNKVVAEVPYFGHSYTWRATYKLPSEPKDVKSSFYHFKTGITPELDSNFMRVRVINPAMKHKDAYVFIDGTKALYDMNGKMVWYHPIESDKPSGKNGIRDLRPTPQGTITFLQDEAALEINYNGDTLYMPSNTGEVSGDTSERYHHEFVRLANGHYMVLGTEFAQWNEHKTTIPPTPNDPDTSKKYGKTSFGTLIEYNEKGKVVWSWKSSEYFKKSDVIYYQPDHKSKTVDVHENAFFFNEKDKTIYISFKNISRIVKIKYPEGTVLASYGETFQPGITPRGNGLFCDQHACRHSQEGYLYLYNNNACNDSTERPKVIMMKEPATGNTLTKVWEYECDISGVNINPELKKAKAKQAQLEREKLKAPLPLGNLLRATSGGNVIELPDQSMFVCMNTQFGKIFIVNRDKKILWSVVPEKFNAAQKTWYIMPQQYRASYVSRQGLEQLIWTGMPAGRTGGQVPPPSPNAPQHK